MTRKNFCRLGGTEPEWFRGDGPRRVPGRVTSARLLVYVGHPERAHDGDETQRGRPYTSRWSFVFAGRGRRPRRPVFPWSSENVPWARRAEDVAPYQWRLVSRVRPRRPVFPWGSENVPWARRAGDVAPYHFSRVRARDVV